MLLLQTQEPTGSINQQETHVTPVDSTFSTHIFSSSSMLLSRYWCFSMLEAILLHLVSYLLSVLLNCCSETLPVLLSCAFVYVTVCFPCSALFLYIICGVGLGFHGDHN